MSETIQEQMNRLYTECDLTKNDIYTHRHYKIITRMGIEKIMHKKDISVTFEVVEAKEDFAVILANATMGDVKVQSFGSALYGGKVKNNLNKWEDVGTTTSRYIIEIAEKRALSRSVLKITNLYSQGHFGEDEMDDLNDLAAKSPLVEVHKPEKPKLTKQVFEQMKEAISNGKGKAVKGRIKEYQMSPSQKTELNKLIGEYAVKEATAK